MVSTPCVNNPDTARKGLKPLVIRIFRILFCVDCHAFIKARPRCVPHGDDRKCTVITSGSEVIHIHKFVNFLNNNVALAHCVNNSEGRKILEARKGLKPLVIRNKDAKNINNNAAFPKGRLWRAHCVHLQIGCKSKTDLLSTSINSDNLSEKNKNLCLVINNKLLSEVQP